MLQAFQSLNPNSSVSIDVDNTLMQHTGREMLGLSAENSSAFWGSTFDQSQYLTLMPQAGHALFYFDFMLNIFCYNVIDLVYRAWYKNTWVCQTTCLYLVYSIIYYTTCINYMYVSCIFYYLLYYLYKLRVYLFLITHRSNMTRRLSQFLICYFSFKMGVLVF